MEHNVIQQEGPKVLAFGIIDSNATHTVNRAEDTASLIKQVVCYLNCREIKQDTNHWSFPWTTSEIELDNSEIDLVGFTFTPEVSDNEIVKTIGLLQAISDMSGKFNGNNKTCISYIDTDKSRTIVGKFISDDDLDGNFWWFVEFQFTKLIMNDNTIQYSHRGLASPEYLKQLIVDGYSLFMLKYGSLLKLVENLELNKVREITIKWWDIWFKNKFEFESSFNITDDSFFKLLPGIRYSCVEKPFGFNQNISERLKSVISENDGLNDIIILNTNWTPNKNWGAIYINEFSKYSYFSLTNIVKFLKDTDLKFGLSTYALTYGNLPSLKQYVDQLRRIQSIKPNGGLLERSLMVPAIYLQDKLTNNVFNPLGDIVNTMESYVPIMNTIKEASEYVPSISTVSNLTLHPWNSMLSYWNRPQSQEEEREEQVVEQIEPVESRHESVHTNHSNIEESLETAHSSGSYLLGFTKQGSIILHGYQVYDKENKTWETVNLVIYEINGILFVLFYDPALSDLNKITFYKNLSGKLDLIYEMYFKDLIVNQLDSLEAEFKNKENHEFSYIICDDKKYWTSVDNIPPDHDTLVHQIPQRIFLLERNLNIDLSIEHNSLEKFRLLSLMQDKQLQMLIKDNTTSSANWIVNEKITKLGKNQWCFFKRYNAEKWVVVIKQLDHCNINNEFIFGDKVKHWFDWVDAGGYM